MRRLGIALVVGLFVGALGAPASGGEHIDVQDEVFQGRRLKIVVNDCVSGKDWVARIRIKIISARTLNTVYADGFRTNDTGRDVSKVRVNAKTFERGLYKALVQCRHEFGPEDNRLFFGEHEGFRVLEPD